MKIYIVVASTGEYENYSETKIGLFESKEKAEKLKSDCSAYFENQFDEWIETGIDCNDEDYSYKSQLYECGEWVKNSPCGYIHIESGVSFIIEEYEVDMTDLEKELK